MYVFTYWTNGITIRQSRYDIKTHTLSQACREEDLATTDFTGKYEIELKIE